MSTYRQRVQAQEQARIEAIKQTFKDEVERQFKASMTAEQCYQAGAERGAEDREDNYTGAIERRTLGDDYAYPEEYREGYRTAYFQEENF